MIKLNRTIVISICALLIGTEPASAYLDPGTGSLILQTLIAGIAGALVVCRLYWAQLKAFLARLFSRGRAQPVADKTLDDAREDRDTEQP